MATAPPHTRGEQPEKRPLRVYPVLLFGLLCFSTSPILVRLAAEAPGLPPSGVAVATWRTVFAALLLAPIALPRVGAEVRAFTRHDALLIGTAGVLLGLHFIAWIESLYHTTVASASVLVTTSPIFLAVLGFLFLKERLSGAVVTAIVLAVGGAVLIGVGDAGTDGHAVAPWLGNSLALTASLLFSIYLLIGRVVRRKASWLAYVFPLYTVVALTVLLVALVGGTPLWGYHPVVYALCAGMALGPQLAGHGSFNYAVRYMPAAVLGILTLVEPIGASVMAYLFFGEMPSPPALLGMGVVLTAVSFALLYDRRRAARRTREAG